ncbi:hypothetical protein LZC95_16955 [Pendulispora brunnea]|uniref:Uncharacterized protein n=1 Tax=Pendulispora brunnea TaxID=2905690 RepID=A0ABZ2KLH5_9BACT
MASWFRPWHVAVAGGALVAAIVLANAQMAVAALAAIAAAALLVAWSVDDRRVRVRANAEGLFIEGKTLVPAHVLADGFLVRKDGNSPRLRLVDRFGLTRFNVRLESEAQGRTLLRALGLDAGHKSATFRVPNALLGVAPFLGILPGAMLLGTYAAEDHVKLLLAALTALLLAAGALRFGYSPVTVGADGVLIRGLGTHSFVPYGQIVRAEVTPYAILLHLTDGSVRTIRAPHPWAKDPLDRRPNPMRDIVAARIEQALYDFRRRATSDDAAAVVARGGRAIADWGAAITGRAAAHYRVAAAPAIPADELWRVAEDPGAEETARAGAAVAVVASVALSTHEDGAHDDVRARLRAAARATASPRVRIALETAADASDEEDLARVLAVFEERS